MEDDCRGANDYWKRSAESDNDLIFMLGPGGRAAVISMQTSDELQVPASQVSGAQATPSAIVVPLSPTTLPNDASATVTETSVARTDTISQLSPGTSPVYTSFDSLNSALGSSIIAETPTLLASSSTDGPSEPSGGAAASLESIPPTTVSSEAVNLKPPIYAGIVLGTIAGIACLTALIAWWIRIRSHAKRRHLYGDTDVPWAPSESADSGLEEARDMTQTRTNLESIGLAGREDLAQVEAWEPRGDRDVGEPRRSECNSNSSSNSSRPFVSLTNDPYSYRAGSATPGQHDSFLQFIRPLQNGPYPGARPLPSHLRSMDSGSSGSIDDHSAAPSLGPLRVANLLPGDRSAATSRAATALGMNSQTYSIRTEDLDDLLSAEAETCGSTLDQRSQSAYSWMDPGILREAYTDSEQRDRPVTAPESDRWTTSLKSIFAAVASNLSVRGRSIRKREDTLTPIPRKRSTRRSISDLVDVSLNGHNTVFPESITNSDAHSVAESDGNKEFKETREPQVPLTDQKYTNSGQLRRDLLSRSLRHDQGCPSQATPSRASSVYSTSSTAPSANCQYDEMLTTLPGESTRRDEKIASTSRPRVTTRVSSTGCSVASSQLTDKEETAQRALIDRRRRARRHGELSEWDISGR